MMEIGDFMIAKIYIFEEFSKDLITNKITEKQKYPRYMSVMFSKEI